MLPAEADPVAIEQQRQVLPRIFTTIESKAPTSEYELANPGLISKSNFFFGPKCSRRIPIRSFAAKLETTTTKDGS